MGLETAAVVGLAFTAASTISTGVSYMEQKDAMKEQKKAQRAETAMQLEENKRAARQVRREQRIKAAAIEQAAQNTGAKGSGLEGAVGSIGSQAASNIGFQGVRSGAAQAISNFNQRAADAEGNALLAGAVGGIFKDWAGVSFGMNK